MAFTGKESLQTTLSHYAARIDMNQFLFVVVVYKMNVADAPTLRSLFERSDLLRQHAVRVLIIDNTPGAGGSWLALDNEVEYVALGKNGGLASAYQIAFRKAKANGCDYLVLLDQDSEVTDELIVTLGSIRNLRAEGVGIWCPRVISCGKYVSPYSVGVFTWPTYNPPSPRSGRVYGINSFSVVNVSFLENIGGFNEFYWLDCLDMWLYEAAHGAGWEVRCLDVTMQHDLSLVSGRVSLDRMKNIAFYEGCFASEYWSAARILGTVVRLCARGVKRLDGLGGVRNYGAYLHEIFKGIRVGLSRRATHGS